MTASGTDPHDEHPLPSPAAPIGPGHPPYVIAEMSGNHNGDIERAFRLIDAAAEAGADAVKLQTYTADTITIDHDGPGFRLEGGLWDGRTLHDLYREAHTPWEWHDPLFDHAKRRGIAIFSSPFDGTAIDLLESLGAPAYKIASFELIDLPLIRRAARTGKPLIISTGMATLGEIEDGVAAARGAGATQILLLHCTSAYPTPPEEANLRTIGAYGAGFRRAGRPVRPHHGHRRPGRGRSARCGRDRKALHARPRRWRPGLGLLARTGRTGGAGRGDEKRLRRARFGFGAARRGEREQPDVPPLALRGRGCRRRRGADRENVRSIRPGFGLAPKHLPEIVGKRAARAIARGTALSWDLVG